MANNICASCGHENEPSRVFCHNCGVRLPRLEAQDAKIGEANREADRKAAELRTAKGTAQSKKWDWHDIFAGWIVTGFHLTVLAAVGAALVLSFRAPAGMPAPTPPDPQLVAAGDSQMQDAATGAADRTISATQEQINSYLSGKINITTRGIGIFGQAEVRRVFVALEDGAFRLGVAYTAAGMPLVVQGRFALVETGEPDRRYGLHLTGGTLGRLQVPRVVFDKLVRWYEPVADALYTPLDQLARAAEIRIAPGQVTVTWKPKDNSTGQSFRSPFSSPPLQPRQLPGNR